MTFDLDGLRAAGQARFSQLGFPTPHQEDWRFTNLAALGRIAFQSAEMGVARLPVDDAALPTVVAAGEPSALRLVFVNGGWCPERSSLAGLPAGVMLTGLGAALCADGAGIGLRLNQRPLADDHALAALNAAFLGDGAVLELAEGVRLERPVELVFVSVGGETPLSWHPRLLINAKAGSEAVVVEHHVSLNGHTTFANSLTELSIGEGARIQHYKVQHRDRPGPVETRAFHLATLSGRLERGAAYEGFLLVLGGHLTRHELHLVLDGAGASACFNSAYLLRDRAHCDITTVIDHATPHGTSRQLVKGVIDDAAEGVFQGKVRVRPGAQKTNAHQLNRALLLSDYARIDAKPELEIYADDVKCSHGATAGDLDDDALFYLRARGIGADEARALLIGAYVAEAIAEISCEPVRTAFEALATGWLQTDWLQTG